MYLALRKSYTNGSWSTGIPFWLSFDSMSPIAIRLQMIHRPLKTARSEQLVLRRGSLLSLSLFSPRTLEVVQERAAVEPAAAALEVAALAKVVEAIPNLIVKTGSAAAATVARLAVGSMILTRKGSGQLLALVLPRVLVQVAANIALPKVTVLAHFIVAALKPATSSLSPRNHRHLHLCRWRSAMLLHFLRPQHHNPPSCNKPWLRQRALSTMTITWSFRLEMPPMRLL